MQEILKKWYLPVLKRYNVFYGRSGRKEFWLFVLINFIIAIILSIIDSIIGKVGPFGMFGVLGTLYSLFVLVPGLALSVRRLHDTGKSGWLLLLGFIPVIGFLILLYFYIQEGTPDSNEYGPNPEMSAAERFVQ